MTKTEILDTYTDKVRPLFGSKAATFKMSLVRTTDSAGVKTTVLVDVASESTETVATSTSVAFGSGSAWAVGSTAVRQTKNAAGRRVMEIPDFDRLIGFFNRSLEMANGPRSDVETLWRFNFDDSFTLALSYIPKSGSAFDSTASPFSYILAMDGAVYAVSYDSSLAMLRKMGAFRKAMGE